MVLQRDKNSCLGTADQRDKILVQLEKKNITAVADENGSGMSICLRSKPVDLTN